MKLLQLKPWMLQLVYNHRPVSIPRYLTLECEISVVHLPCISIHLVLFLFLRLSPPTNPLKNSHQLHQRTATIIHPRIGLYQAEIRKTRIYDLLLHLYVAAKKRARENGYWATEFQLVRVEKRILAFGYNVLLKTVVAISILLV